MNPLLRWLFVGSCVVCWLEEGRTDATPVFAPDHAWIEWYFHEHVDGRSS
jgi:hypothetical protein